MSKTFEMTPQSRRDFFKTSAGASRPDRRPRRQPGACPGGGVRRVGKAAEGGVLQRRPAGDLVRPGQAGGGILGQALQRGSDLVRRPARRGEAARRDRQHGLAGLGLCRDPGVRHRHADAAGAGDDRQGHAGHRHGHADRAARPDQRPHFPRTRQRVHGLGGDAGAGDRHRRQGQGRDDARRARPYRRAGPRQGLQVGDRELPRHRGARRAAGRLGRLQGFAHLGDASDPASADRRGVLPQ